MNSLLSTIFYQKLCSLGGNKRRVLGKTGTLFLFFYSLRQRKIAIFLPIFAHFKSGLFWGIFGHKMAKKCSKFLLAKKSGLLATFKNGFGHKKPSIHAGSRAFCPLSHFFSLFAIKVENYILLI